MQGFHTSERESQTSAALNFSATGCSGLRMPCLWIIAPIYGVCSLSQVLGGQSHKGGLQTLFTGEEGEAEGGSAL